MTETPESEIRMKFGQEGEEHLIFYHISELIVDPINKTKQEENETSEENQQKFWS